jgi:hypothetical protein
MSWAASILARFFSTLGRSAWMSSDTRWLLAGAGLAAAGCPAGLAELAPAAAWPWASAFVAAFAGKKTNLMVISKECRCHHQSWHAFHTGFAPSQSCDRFLNTAPDPLRFFRPASSLWTWIQCNESVSAITNE